MASTPMIPPNADGSAPMAPPLPGTDMTSICFRDQLWLNTYPLDRNLVFDYFALSPFYDWTCNNEQLRARAIHPLDFSHISKMTGMEYTLSEVMEPNLFVIRKQKRDSPEKVTPMLAYYILDGSIYQLRSSAMYLQLDLGVLYIIYQKLSVLHPQSWKRLDMWSRKMIAKHLKLSPPKRPSTSRNLSELITSLLLYNGSYHQYHRLHLSQKAMHPLPLQNPLNTSNQRLSRPQLILLLIKARLRE